jgi:hypothetical protein
MRIPGYVTTVILVAAAVALGLMAVRSWPDGRRYLKIRSM